MDTPNLGMPEISEAQASKYLTHNTALRILDSLVQARVLDKDLTEPPATPVDGDRYLIGADVTGEWADHVGELAYFCSTAWWYMAPKSGWQVFIADEGIVYVCDGGDPPTWSPFIDRAYEIPTFFSGSPAAEQVILIRPVPFDVTFPIDLAGSLGRCGTVPTNSTVFSIRVNDVEVATMTFASGSNDAVFADAGSSAVSIAAGDRLSIVGPDPADTAIGDISLCLVGRRS